MFEIYMQPMLSNYRVDHILKNLPHCMNHDVRILDEVLDFLRKIYAQGGDKQIIRRLSQTFLRNALIDYPNLFQLRNSIESEIDKRFRLLGLNFLEVMEDFTIAFQILEEERKLKNGH